MSFGDLRDEGNNVNFGMDANDNVRDGEVTKALMEIGMYKTVVSNHGGECSCYMRYQQAKETS